MSHAATLRAAILASAICTPHAALAADGPLVITQASALAGRITPDDNPGFPITISQGGSYRLGSNLQATAGRNGIVVTASGVTLDMQGFTLTGERVALSGIYVAPGMANISVRDGAIGKFKARGISADDVHLLTIDGLRIFHNGTEGAYLGGYARVSGSNVSSNLGLGIQCEGYCLIKGNIVAANSKEGLVLNEGAVLGNTIVFNKLVGIRAGWNVATGQNLISQNNDFKEEQTTGYVTPMQPNVCSHSGREAAPC